MGWPARDQGPDDAGRCSAGGVRRGPDIVKALALGATACAIGCPYLCGLAAGGEAGVTRALVLLRAEFERTLVLAGVPDIAALGDSNVRRRRPSRSEGGIGR